ncbi:hypothetical protein [Actinacidiphila acidipaludis]|uniref:Integral membrane protein n=1 Tax=Actinacidiphila acidipaludis TaxID=2873382 RepID=A0ABS7QCQ7_9ACTN|nr:hypothetical protein [Streptomyces acidipaludis]MBY8880957.1 hypothetical protein [Streptomyces acidipaludis]
MTAPGEGDASTPEVPPQAPGAYPPPAAPPNTPPPGFPHATYGTHETFGTPAEGYGQGGYDQGAYGTGGYDATGYGNDGHGTGGYANGGYANGGYANGGYAGYPDAAHGGGTYQDAGHDGGFGNAGHGTPGQPRPGYTGGGHLDPGYPSAGRPGPVYPGPGFGHGGQPQTAPRTGTTGFPGPGPHDSHLGHSAAAAGPGEDGTYVPEPLVGQLPDEADPGAAFGLPSSGDAWGGHAAARGAFTGPAGGAGWGQAPSAAQPWDHQPAADAPAGYAPAEPQPQWSRQQPHTYAAQQPFAGTEHTAVLPTVGEEPPPAAASSATGGGPVRTGSPIIPPGIQPAAITAALGLLIAGAAALGKPGLAVVLLVLEGVTAAGWFRLNGMWPARQGIMLAFLAGVTADVALLAAGGSHNAEVLLGTLGVWLLLVLILQLRHHGSADERLSSLTATSASTLLTVVAAGYLATAASGAGSDPVVVGAIAVAAATLVRAVRLPGGEPVSLALSLLAALVTGLATGPATGMGTGHGVLLAVASGACALVGLRVASYDFPSRFVHFTAGVALPLTAAAPVVYALGNALH